MSAEEEERILWVLRKMGIVRATKSVAIFVGVAT